MTGEEVYLEKGEEDRRLELLGGYIGSQTRSWPPHDTPHGGVLMGGGKPR